MAEKLRVGILGAGWAGEGHAVAFARQENVEVTALWSRTRRRAEELVGKLNLPGVQVFDHWQDLIEQTDVDVISLATPPMLRLEPFAMAIEQGCHVLVEKPFSIGLADANAMVYLARGRDLVTTTSFNWRYSPANLTAWRELNRGQIGRILDVHAEWHFRLLEGGNFANCPWTTSLDVGDSLLGEGGSHEIDKIRFLSGSEFESIVTRYRPYAIPQDNGFTFDVGTQMHIAELSNGVLGNIRIGCTAGQHEWSVRINGDSGSLFVGFDSVSRQTDQDDAPILVEIAEADQCPNSDIMQHTWNRLITDFISAIRAGDKSHATVPLLPSLEDGLRSQQVIIAARRSQDKRRWINIDEVT